MRATKRQHGQFFTNQNPFAHPAFRRWATKANIPAATILEPFAGCNSLIDHLQGMDLCRDYRAYDITPAGMEVVRRNTLDRFPRGLDVCVTNPPWLARNSATLRGLDFPDTPYDDLYKHALSLCLDNCEFVAALVPESFIRSGLFHDRLQDFVSLTKPIFKDTAHPVGLALFVPETTPHVTVYSGRDRVGRLKDIEKCLPQSTLKRKVVFNDPDGNLGLIAVDNTYRASIRFCPTHEIEKYEIVDTSRYITKLSVSGSVNIDKLNQRLRKFREDTFDVLMTPYRGLRKDGMYRRRLDWKLARGIVCNS